jgi:hypothetical protein
VFFVALSAITDPALVAPAIAQALEVPEEAGRPRLETLAAYLAERSSLLLLDNFEQVLSAAPAVEHLLTSAPGLHVVCTSREPLHLPGERQYPVPPLDVPDLTTSDTARRCRLDRECLVVRVAGPSGASRLHPLASGRCLQHRRDLSSTGWPALGPSSWQPARPRSSDLVPSSPDSKPIRPP